MTGRVVCGLRLIGAESASDLPHHIAKSAKKMPVNMQDKARIVRSIIQNCQSTSRPALIQFNKQEKAAARDSQSSSRGSAKVYLPIAPKVPTV